MKRFKIYKYEYTFAVKIAKARSANQLYDAYRELEFDLLCAVGQAELKINSGREYNMFEGLLP